MGKYILVGFFLGPEKQPPNHTACFSIFLNNKKYNVVSPVLPQEMVPSVSLEVLLCRSTIFSRIILTSMHQSHIYCLVHLRFAI